MPSKGSVPKFPLRRNRLLLAIALGFSVSALLATLASVSRETAWMVLQLPGFLLGELIWGMDNGGNKFELLMIVTNGAFYSICILLLSAALRFIRQGRLESR